VRSRTRKTDTTPKPAVRKTGRVEGSGAQEDKLGGNLWGRCMRERGGKAAQEQRFAWNTLRQSGSHRELGKGGLQQKGGGRRTVHNLRKEKKRLALKRKEKKKNERLPPMEKKSKNRETPKQRVEERRSILGGKRGDSYKFYPREKNSSRFGKKEVVKEGRFIGQGKITEGG